MLDVGVFCVRGYSMLVPCGGEELKHCVKRSLGSPSSVTSCVEEGGELSLLLCSCNSGVFGGGLLMLVAACRINA